MLFSSFKFSDGKMSTASLVDSPGVSCLKYIAFFACFRVMPLNQEVAEKSDDFHLRFVIRFRVTESLKDRYCDDSVPATER